eukprot:12907193-Alexandrium_andersonii.AAC.1
MSACMQHARRPVLASGSGVGRWREFVSSHAASNGASSTDGLRACVGGVDVGAGASNGVVAGLRAAADVGGGVDVGAS